MILPILICVSVAPISYFFWASALLPMAASKMTAVENAANRRATNDISFLPNEISEGVCCCRGPFAGLLPILNTLHQNLSISANAAARALSAFGRFVNVADPTGLELCHYSRQTTGQPRD